MKTEIVKGGIAFLRKDYDAVLEKTQNINNFLTDYVIKSQNVNQQIALLLADLNRADGGGPIATLVSLDAHLNSDLVSGKVAIAYQLKLEWGCEAIKKDILKYEKFDFEIEVAELKLFLYLFMV